MDAVHRLVGLWMLPTFGGRGGRKAGTLEAHTNGLRYVGAKADEQVDVIYSNIKFAFFQPAKKEIKTLIHFHLHDAIMIGKKKTKDVQFYMEIMEAVQSLDGGRRNMYDPDEIEEEQRDREREKRIHKEFSGFCRKVQDIWEKDFPKLRLEFDSPYHDLAFDGVPFKSTVRILPTATCLVELTEFPPLVISADDIEVVNLERVGFHLKNFDMAIIFKDFNRDVHRIDQIPVQNLDNIKQWLATLDIKYYEGKSNLNWKPLLKQIKEDPDEWLESGGWEFLNNEIDDEDEEGEERGVRIRISRLPTRTRTSPRRSPSPSRWWRATRTTTRQKSSATQAWTGTSSRRRRWLPTRRPVTRTTGRSARRASDDRSTARREASNRAVHAKRDENHRLDRTIAHNFTGSRPLAFVH